MLKAFKDFLGKGEFSNENQEEIIRLAKAKSFIALNPVPPKEASGHVSHYYHFIFDLAFPLSLLIEQTSSNVKYVLCDIGILTPMLVELFGEHIEILQNFDAIDENEVVDLMGMNPIKVDVSTGHIKNFRAFIYSKLNFVPTTKPNKILLIERLPSDEYYLQDTERRGAGATRRSIKNHRELEQTIRSIVGPNHEFHNLTLENMSLEEQLTYFDSAAMVIGQHGAGLANMLWMQEKSAVVEFGFKSKKHFQKIGSALNIEHFVFDYNARHLEINCEEIKKWLVENQVTNRYFNA